MGLVAAGFAVWFISRKNWVWLLAAIATQVPYWGGWVAFLVTGDPAPVGVNMCLNLVAAAAFVEWGHRLAIQGRGGVIHIWLAVVFTGAASIDVIQSVHEMPLYVLTQEVIHYIALIIIGGRAYVRGLDGSHRNRGNGGDLSSRGGVV